jgi:hypothetical protein
MAAVSVQQVTRTQFAAHLRGLSIRRLVTWLVFHHTWRPTGAQYAGRSTIWGVTRYHVDHNGWRDNGYHVMIGRDGSIWLCRPMADTGAHCVARNPDSIGVSVVLDGDKEAFFGTAQHAALVDVLAMLAARFGIDPAVRLGPHARWDPKTCPGTGITREWARLVRDVQVAMGQKVVVEQPPPRVNLGRVAAPNIIDCDPALEDGRLRVTLRPLIEGLGFGLDWRADLNKAFIDVTAGGILGLLPWMREDELLQLHDRLSEGGGEDDDPNDSAEDRA